jgi:phosphocarrier protein HPr
VSASSEEGRAEGSATLPTGVDLHARPAADFVRTAMRFPDRTWVALGEREVDAKSLLSILALGAKGGTELRLRAEGDQADAAVTALADCVVNLH